MVKLCKYTCSICGKKFDKYSGQLVNLSDSALKWYYAMPQVKYLIQNKKHSILCADCIERLHGPLKESDFKLKNGKPIIANLCYKAVKLGDTELLDRIKKLVY